MVLIATAATDHTMLGQAPLAPENPFEFSKENYNLLGFLERINPGLHSGVSVDKDKKEEEKKKREQADETASYAMNSDIGYLEDLLDQQKGAFETALDDLFGNLDKTQEINEQLQEQGYITIQDENRDSRLVFEENGEQFLLLNGERVELTAEQQAAIEGQEGRFASLEEIENNPTIAEHLNITDSIKQNGDTMIDNYLAAEETEQKLAAEKTGITNENYQEEVLNRVEKGQMSIEGLRELTLNQDRGMIKKIEEFMSENDITIDYQTQIDQYTTDSEITIDELKTVTEGLRFAHNTRRNLGEYLDNQNISITGIEEKLAELTSDSSLSLDEYSELTQGLPDSVVAQIDEYREKNNIEIDLNSPKEQNTETTETTQGENDAPAPEPVEETPIKIMADIVAEYPDIPEGDLYVIADMYDVKFSDLNDLKDQLIEAKPELEKELRPENTQQTLTAGNFVPSGTSSNNDFSLS